MLLTSIWKELPSWAAAYRDTKAAQLSTEANLLT